MTQDEIIEIAQKCRLVGMRPHLDGIYIESLVAFAKLVEEKALAQTQEPVIDKSAAIRIATSLGWTPQRKPLTDEEIGKIAGETLDPWSCARAIEAAHGIKENT